IEENPAARLPQRSPVPNQDRSLLSPHGKPQLSADGRALLAADARHGDPFLSGLVSDAAHRRAALHGLHILHLLLLSRFPEGALSAQLAQDFSLSSLPHGARHRS